MSTTLILVDVQNDYFPGGLMELEGSLGAAEQARRLLEHFRRLCLPVIHVRHLSDRPGAAFFLPGTPGAEIHELLRPLGGESVVEKHYPNAFRDTLLLHRLLESESSRVVIAGMMTHMCIDATTRAAFDQGFRCTVAQDACTTRALPFNGRVIPADVVHESFLAALQGVYAEVRSASEIIDEMPVGLRVVS
jgi:nicotinamidase-related amidase